MKSLQIKRFCNLHDSVTSEHVADDETNASVTSGELVEMTEQAIQPGKDYQARELFLEEAPSRLRCSGISNRRQGKGRVLNTNKGKEGHLN